jgi:hypothetical protein
VGTPILGFGWLDSGLGRNGFTATLVVQDFFKTGLVWFGNFEFGLNGLDIFCYFVIFSRSSRANFDLKIKNNNFRQSG